MPTAPTNYFGPNGLIPVYADGVRRQPVQLPASKTYLKGTILGEQIGLSEIDTLTFTATGGTFTLTFATATGTVGVTAAITYSAGLTAATIQTAVNLVVAAVGKQTVTLTSATGGNFQLGYYGQVTAPLAYNATAAQVQTALQNLPNVGSGNMTVTGSAGGPYTIVTAGTLANTFFPPLGLFGAALTPTTATIATVVNNPGGGASDVVVTGSAGGPYTITYQNALGYQPMTTTVGTGSLTGGSASIAVATAGSAGTPGTFIAYLSTATDGSQIPKCILEFDCATDANGNITFGQTAGSSEWGQTWPSAPAFYSGDFKTNDLIGLDANALTISVSGWRLVSGDMGAPFGGVVRLP